MKYSELLGFPLMNDSKLPAVRGWSDYDYVPLGTLRQTNKGVICGRPNKLLVVDCDVKGAKNGIEQFSFLMQELGYGGIPDTLMIATPSGGVHYYFYLPDEALDMRKQPREDLGIDFQMNGSFVVGAESYNADVEHDGEYSGYYTVGMNKPIIDVPSGLLRWLQSNEKKFTNKATGQLNRSLSLFFNVLGYEAERLEENQYLLNDWQYKFKANTNLDNDTISDAIILIYQHIYRKEPIEPPRYSRAKGLEHNNALGRFLNELVNVRQSEGGRNNALARVAGSLALGTNDFVWYQWVCQLYCDNCFIEPMENTEFMLTIQSIWKREKGM